MTTTSPFKHPGIRHDIKHLFPAVDQISKATPRIQDAKRALAALAIREMAPLTELVNYFLHTIPDQTFYCERCRETVPMYEFATDMCLDCVQAAYTELFNG